MSNKTPNKRLIAAILCILGIILLLYASCSKQQPDSPTTIITPEQTSTTQNSTTTTKPQTNLDERLLAGQLSLVHGVGNRNELVAIPHQFTQKDELIHKDVYDPLMTLIGHAQNDGIRLSIVSAYRSYEHQKRIWERKWGDTPNNDANQALKNLEYSSFPGTSRHHWGTDIDFNSVSLSYWQSDEGKQVHAWLTANAPQYGFCQTYGNNRTSGYANEDWHWSHMPTAEYYYTQINHPQVLAIATSQPVKGAIAIQNMSSQLYHYIRGISPCTNINTSTNTITDNQPTIDTPPTTQSQTSQPITNIHGQQGSW